LPHLRSDNFIAAVNVGQRVEHKQRRLAFDKHLLKLFVERRRHERHVAATILGNRQERFRFGQARQVQAGKRPPRRGPSDVRKSSVQLVVLVFRRDEFSDPLPYRTSEKQGACYDRRGELERQQ
jgi:hypothetical protein